MATQNDKIASTLSASALAQVDGVRAEMVRAEIKNGLVHVQAGSKSISLQPNGMALLAVGEETKEVRLARSGNITNLALAAHNNPALAADFAWQGEMQAIMERTFAGNMTGLKPVKSIG